MGSFLDIYNFLMENQIFIAVFLALIVSLAFRGADLLRWIRRKVKPSSLVNPPEEPQNPNP